MKDKLKAGDIVRINSNERKENRKMLITEIKAMNGDHGLALCKWRVNGKVLEQKIHTTNLSLSKD